MTSQESGLITPVAAKPTPRWQTWLSTAVSVVVLLLVALQAYQMFFAPEELPGCDSQRAKDTLSNVFTEKNLHPVSYREVKTISTAKDAVECEAFLPNPDKTVLDVKYKFFWSGKTAQLQYTIAQLPN